MQDKLTDSEREFYPSVSQVPGNAFFFPEFLKGVDRGLSKEVRRFWATSPSELLCAAPYLTSEYDTYSVSIQRVLGSTIEEIWSVTFREPDRERVMIPLMLRVIESEATEAKLRRALLWDVARRLNSDQYRELLEWGRGRSQDAENRVDWIYALRGWRPGTVPKEVREHLLEISESDSCHECRVMSVQDKQMVELGEERVRPIYERLMVEAFEAKDRDMMEVLTFALRAGSNPLTSIPCFMKGLDSADRYIQASSVATLVIMTGANEPREFHFLPTERIDKSPEDLAALERSVAAWQGWWTNKGRRLFESGDVTAVQESARNVYAPRSSS